MVDAHAYAGAVLTRKAGWVALTFPGAVTAPRMELRRIKQSKFDRGSIGWSYSTSPSRGVGEPFFTLNRQDGLDALYQEVGHVVEGIERLEALRVVPMARLRGHPRVEPAVVGSLTRRAMAAA